jgi:hypothetical protein
MRMLGPHREEHCALQGELACMGRSADPVEEAFEAVANEQEAKVFASSFGELE